ncbi:hypothetical protein [Massilia sp. YIM B04103]|uniref:hypothetical protein n=1 Tax=Massilia sp. YIM B04103 TaxID=2963106 RepID=UPI0021094A52|nr:hypothetical protein [Massilia sp. YIM B04103]
MPAHASENVLLRFWNWISLTDHRLRQLKSAGYTLELAGLRLPVDGTIVEIDLGYGREYWLAPAGQLDVERKTRRLRGGRLLLDGERPVPNEAVLRKYGLALDYKSGIKF